MDRPLRRKGVRLEFLEDECLLYDEENVRIHILNPVAGSVWEMCDGEHTLQEMEARLREQYEVAEGASVERDLQEIVRELARLGLLAPTDP